MMAMEAYARMDILWHTNLGIPMPAPWPFVGVGGKMLLAHYNLRYSVFMRWTLNI